MWIRGKLREVLSVSGLIQTMAVSDVYPIHIGPSVEKAKLSFVYDTHQKCTDNTFTLILSSRFRDDVVSAVFAAVEAGPSIHGQAFSIPFQSA